MPVLHPESAGDDPELHKSKFFIQAEGMGITAHHRVKLHNSKSHLLCRLQTMCDQNLTDPVSTQIFSYCIACITYMPASSYIIGMQDIQAHDFTCFFLVCDPGKRLFLKKRLPCLFRQHFLLGKCNALLNHLVPYIYSRDCITSPIFFHFYLHFHFPPKNSNFRNIFSTIHSVYHTKKLLIRACMFLSGASVRCLYKILYFILY